MVYAANLFSVQFRVTSLSVYASSASFAVLAMVKPIRTRPAATTFAVHPAKPVDSPSIMVMLAW